VCYDPACHPVDRLRGAIDPGQEHVRVLIDYRPALRERTGVGEWVHSLVAALAEAKIDDSRSDPSLDLTVFSSSWKDRLGPVPAGVHPVDRQIPVRALNYCWHTFGWPPIEWIVGEAFDVVHSPHPLLIPTTRAARVVTIHDLDFLDHPERAEAEIRRDYPDLVRTHARNADHVIVPSHFTRAEVERRLGIPPDRITVCHNGAPDWTPRQSWPDDGHILFVGALAPRKNIGCLLDAYRLLVEDPATNPPPLVLAGPPTSQAADWLTAIETPPLQGRVQCMGYVDRATLRTLYEGAAVLVLPSLHEGFGLPVVEAMTVGVPVVVSDRGALPEVAGRAGLIVDPLQPSQLAGAIDRILKDEHFRRACVERGFQQAAGFSWKRSAIALKTAYERAYNQTSPIS